MDGLLSLLEKNARLTTEQMAAMLGSTKEQVEAQIEQYQKDGVILGYKALIDWEKTDRDLCIARIELKVTPKSGMGFDEIAHRIAQFEEVETLYLMSGGYDLALTVSSTSFKDVAMFVARRLAPLDSVESTSTHFVLRKYKERGVTVYGDEGDGREVTSL